MTSFFDIKLILIIFLATLIYFIYKELILLKQKINYLFIKNKDIVATPNEQLINEFLENTHEVYHEQHEQHPQQYHQHPQIFNDPFSCLFKKIVIPIQGNFIKKNTNDKIVLEDHEVEDCEIKKDENEDEDEVKVDEIEECEIKKNKEPIIILDKIEPTVIIESDIKTEIDSPLEIYSNDDSISISPVIFDNNNKSNINILNLTKYKLPELQDIALEYGITLQINTKKKTKNELINDIKNYLNKNI